MKDEGEVVIAVHPFNQCTTHHEVLRTTLLPFKDNHFCFADVDSELTQVTEACKCLQLLLKSCCAFWLQSEVIGIQQQWHHTSYECRRINVSSLMQVLLQAVNMQFKASGSIDTPASPP